jgi:hypothetical protein
MSQIASEPQSMPLPARCAFVGAMLVGAIGAAIGLVVGLLAYPPTAWFAVFELGLPACIAGGTVGLIFGLSAALITGIGRRLKARRIP